MRALRCPRHYLHKSSGNTFCLIWSPALALTVLVIIGRLRHQNYGGAVWRRGHGRCNYYSSTRCWLTVSLFRRNAQICRFCSLWPDAMRTALAFACGGCTGKRPPRLPRVTSIPGGVPMSSALDRGSRRCRHLNQRLRFKSLAPNNTPPTARAAGIPKPISGAGALRHVVQGLIEGAAV
jgi:hypothetical protein